MIPLRRDLGYGRWDPEGVYNPRYRGNIDLNDQRDGPGAYAHMGITRNHPTGHMWTSTDHWRDEYIDYPGRERVLDDRIPVGPPGESFHESAYERDRSWYKYFTLGAGLLGTAAVGALKADTIMQQNADTGLRASKAEVVASGESRVAQRNESAAVTPRPETSAAVQISATSNVTPRV